MDRTRTVAEPTIQDMRKFNRRIFDLQEEITYYSNKLDAALQRCGFRLSNYVVISKMKIQVTIARKILVAVWHMLSKQEDFIDIYLKRLREGRKLEEQIRRFESTAVN